MSVFWLNCENSPLFVGTTLVAGIGVFVLKANKRFYSIFAESAFSSYKCIEIVSMYKWPKFRGGETTFVEF